MPATIPTISKEELLEKLNTGSNVQVVNVLEPEHYNLGFIKNSKRIPESQLDNRMNELDKSREVVTYCASAQCPKSRMAAEKLAQQGFNVKAYEGGIQEWRAAGLPTT